MPVETPGRGSARRHNTTPHCARGDDREPVGRGDGASLSSVRDGRSSGQTTEAVLRPTRDHRAAPRSAAATPSLADGDLPEPPGPVDRNTASRCAGLSCGRRLRLPLPVRLLLVPLAALLIVPLVLVIWTLPELEPKPVREELRNGCPATHSPGPSGTELCSGAGSAGGGRPDQDCFRSAAPEGRKDLGPVGRRRRGRPLR